MNAEAILQKIEEDAVAAADRLNAEAQSKAEAMKAASRAKIEGMHNAVREQANRDSDELEQRMLRMAALDVRKALLEKKRALLNEVFAKARILLHEAPAQEKRAFFLSQAARYANGGETLLIGDEYADWFDADFLADINRAMQAIGKPGALTLANEPAKGCEGLILQQSGMEIRCTFDALLDEQRPALEQQVAEMLFGEL